MMHTLCERLHIYLVQIASVKVPASDVLSEKEHSKAARFIYEKDRQQYIKAHVFLRQTLSRYASIAPNEWQFGVNRYGKPAVINPGYQDVQFNLSHTNDWLAIAVTAFYPVGIDIEQGARVLDNLTALSRRVFTAEELAEIFSEAQNPVVQHNKFFTYWTLKEAYIKARGIGMSLPLREFFFTQHPFLPNQWQLTCLPFVEDQGSRWQCHAHKLKQNVFLAYVAATHIQQENIKLHLPSDVNT